MAATTLSPKMSPAEAGQALLASAEAVRAVVQALADGRLDPPRTYAGFRRFAPHFDRTVRRNAKPYTLAWLGQQIGSQYCRGQASLWITAALQLNINLERGEWGQTELEKALHGEKGFTCHALVEQYRKESRARLKYVRRNRKKKHKAKPVVRKAVGFGHASLS